MILFMTKKKLREMIKNISHSMIQREEKCKELEAKLYALHEKAGGGQPYPTLRDIMGVPFEDIHRAYDSQRFWLSQRMAGNALKSLTNPESRKGGGG